MKCLRLLPALALSLFSFENANAAEDFTNPLYLPSEGEVLSSTSIGYEREKFDSLGTKEDFLARENLMFGIADETAVIATIGNRFNFSYLTNKDYNNELNLDYELGIAKNFRFENGWLMQANASYHTFDPESWYGHNGVAKEKIEDIYGNTRWQKEIAGEVMAGYELEDGLMPYASLGLSSNIDDADRTLQYSVFAGVHKTEYQFSYDAGLRYDFETTDDKNQNWYMEGAADYFFSDNMSVGGVLKYRFGGENEPDVDYGYSAEARFKILF